MDEQHLRLTQDKFW